MKKTVFIFLWLLSFYKTTWSQERKIIDLASCTPFVEVKKVPFNEVTVLDTRTDTTQIGLVQEDFTNELIPVNFHKGIKQAISEHIRSCIEELAKEPKRLLVNIKKLATFEKERPNYEIGLVEFSADAYIQMDSDQYAKIFDLDTLYTMVRPDVTHAVLRKILEPIDSMISMVCKYQLNNLDTSSLISQNEVISGTRKSWLNYPVNKAVKQAIGIYKSFEDFRENRIDTTAKVAMILNDGRYNVYALDRNKRPDKKHMITDIWGICDGKNIYYRINESFVPLVQMNHTFYFVATIEDYYKHDDRQGSEITKFVCSNYTKVIAPYQELYSSMSGLMVSSLVERKKKLYYYFDMDTGQVKEHRLKTAS